VYTTIRKHAAKPRQKHQRPRDRIRSFSERAD